MDTYGDTYNRHHSSVTIYQPFGLVHGSVAHPTYPVASSKVTNITMAREKEAVVEESNAKKAFRTLIETYKAQNPKKYAEKEAVLLAKLETL